MDASGLSSNWKKLQATLKAQPSSKVPSKLTSQKDEFKASLKRKSPAVATQTYSDNKKRRKDTWVAPSSKKPRMNGDQSSTTLSKVNAQNGTTSARSNSTSNPATTPSHDHANASDSPVMTTPNLTLAGRYVSLDCEMVGTHSLTPLSIPAHNQSPTGPTEYSILARVSIVNFALQPLYDAYVLPPPGVTICDYRTRWSGITAWHLHPENSVTKPKTFEQAQADVDALLKDRVLVGHALKNDLDVLGISHPRRDIRDTSRHAPFRALGAATPGGKGRTPSLKRLAAEILGQRIQGDEVKGHSSVEDAKAAMELFRKEKKSFEREHQIVWGRDGRRGPKGEKVGKNVVVQGDEAVQVKLSVEARKDRAVSVDEDSREDDVERDSDEEDDDDDDDDEDLGSYDEDEEATATKTKSQPKKKKKKKKKKSRTKRA